MTRPTSQRCQVHLLGLPLKPFAQMLERQAELIREYTLAGPQGHARVLQERYLAFTAGTAVALSSAPEEGEEHLDVVVSVPAEAGEQAKEFAALLAEIDVLCERGELLALPAIPEVRALRQWFLGEFVAQTSGNPPTPWSDCV